jgi:hypothetical protein
VCQALSCLILSTEISTQCYFRTAIPYQVLSAIHHSGRVLDCFAQSSAFFPSRLSLSLHRSPIRDQSPASISAQIHLQHDCSSSTARCILLPISLSTPPPRMVVSDITSPPVPPPSTVMSIHALALSPTLPRPRTTSFLQNLRPRTRPPHLLSPPPTLPPPSSRIPQTSTMAVPARVLMI